MATCHGYKPYVFIKNNSVIINYGMSKLSTFFFSGEEMLVEKRVIYKYHTKYNVIIRVLSSESNYH